MSRKSEYLPTDFKKFGINGYYDNRMKDSTVRELWTTLKENYRFEWDTLKTKKTIVKLELIDNEKLNISLMNEGKVLDKFYVNGKVKGDYFSVDKNLTFIPFFPIYYMHKESKTILGNDNDGNLIVVHGYIGEGHILIMGGGTRRINSTKYKRIENKN
ncbi:hypothetical protein CLV33_1224 [Jejuia pallidilutea]|uniref:Uncharacterized protein n=1 Tax=Jejuia pallidilutea TaxID=504487 RepID=A0A362X7D0_9FLAO|nr:hypothetical protein [Jejuia pallidilutea]PQV44490.1 hypothetical protein CLV33_1224 [Jejuia pallidilutea]